MSVKSNKNPYRLLWTISKGSRALYLAAVLFMLLAVFCSFLLPQVVRFVVDNVVGGKPISDIPIIPWLLAAMGEGYRPEALRGRLLVVGVLVVAIAAFGGLCTFAYRQCLAMGAEGMIKRLRDTLYAHIQYLPYEWHTDIQTGDIIQRCTSDVDVVQSFIFVQLIEVARTVVLVVFAYALLLPLNVPMSLASMAFLPVIFLFSHAFLRQVSGRFLAADEAEGELLSIAQENFTGVRVVRAFGRERYEVDRFDAQNRLFTDLWVSLGNVLSVYWGLGDLLTGLQMVTICLVGTFQAAAGGITVGGFIVFLTYNAMIIWPVRGLGRVLSEASKTGVSLTRLQEILDAPQETDPDDALDGPEALLGDIAFDRVSFAYGDAPVLREVSFTVERGTTLGILGATGSGKTTVVHLLCRLYDLEPGCGVIRIGGVDIRRFKRAWLRANVGIVLQEPFLFSRTIRENMASLSPRYSMEQIRRAATISQIHDDIEEFAHGYDTVVGERGVTLSGGQKQRVAIARAILKEPPIMIFDDSLSAVDTETDARIREALAGRTKGVTTLIIAHRITSISAADKVIVMEAGRIVEMGTPAELMVKNGTYKRIYDMQQSMEEEIA